MYNSFFFFLTPLARCSLYCSFTYCSVVRYSVCARGLETCSSPVVRLCCPIYLSPPILSGLSVPFGPVRWALLSWLWQPDLASRLSELGSLSGLSIALSEKCKWERRWVQWEFGGRGGWRIRHVNEVIVLNYTLPVKWP